MALTEALAGLLESDAYPHATRAIRLVETHISWVLLTGEFAYKIKRPVHFPFVDFRELVARAHFCREELRLNRRYAPDLYLEVCAIIREPRGVRVMAGPGAADADEADRGEPIEYAVRMRQFDTAAELGALLAAGAVGTAELRVFGTRLAAIHARERPRTRVGSTADPVTPLAMNADQGIEVAASDADAVELRRLRRALVAAGEARRPLLEAREHGGRVRECHGDLHAANIVAFGGELVAFDCLEFDESLRVIDVAEEIAFLTMDLGKRGHPAESAAFLNGYLATSGDYEACRLLRLFEAHFALVRAKVESLRARSDPAHRDEALLEHRCYVEYAAERLGPRRVACVVVAGVSGSGKSWLASRLALEIGAVHVRSDVERKRLAGLGPTVRPGEATGATRDPDLYSRERTAEVYRRLEVAALSILDGGLDAIVDATFRHRDGREAFIARLSAGGYPVCLLWCDAPPEELRRRIERRAAANTDPSDADVTVLESQLATVEPPLPDEQPHLATLDTRASDVIGRAAALVALARGPARPARGGPAR